MRALIREFANDQQNQVTLNSRRDKIVRQEFHFRLFLIIDRNKLIFGFSAVYFETIIPLFVIEWWWLFTSIWVDDC